jgi:hypothetical protein
MDLLTAVMMVRQHFAAKRGAKLIDYGMALIVADVARRAQWRRTDRIFPEEPYREPIEVRIVE